MTNTPTLETGDLILRKFARNDADALFLLLKDRDANTFLPWFPAETKRDSDAFLENKILPLYQKERAYFYAVCLKSDNAPIGYVKAETEDGFDFGYALRKEFWNRGITTQAGRALIGQLKKDKIPYITATHDVNNGASGAVMKKLGMIYRYSYVEQWQPKNFPVTFRMYQLNFDARQDRVYEKYRRLYPNNFVEENV